MSSNRFLDELHGGVFLGDGAIGTELFARGAVQDRGIEHLNIQSPELVLKLHQDYVAAGSRVIETNTFAANRPNLARYGFAPNIREIVLAGVHLARTAAKEGVYVGGSIGPLPTVEGEPFDAAEQREFYTELISILLEGRVDLLILESFSNLDDLSAAVSLGRSLTDLPIVAQMAFGPGGFTSENFSAAEAAAVCIDAGADVIGANCGYGLPSVIDAIRQMASRDVPMSAYMNAGFPERVEGRLVYHSSDDYLASGAAELIDLGVRLIGGCCGTGPNTIRAFAKSIHAKERPTAVMAETLVRSERPSTTQEIICTPAPTPGRILVELDSPADPDLTSVTNAGMALKDSGIDAITVADNPLASIRIDTLTVAAHLERATGLTILPHLTGRDRNKLALQSTIMGAHVLGIRHLLCVTGDPVRMCQDTNTSGVFDVNSIGLVRLVSNFNTTHCAEESGRTAFSIGVALNPNVRSLTGQIIKLQRKIEAGANYALTQPIFAEDRLDALCEALEQAKIEIPIYVGILPLTSAGNARFLHNEVPGIVIPDAIREALSRYESVADQRAVAAEICSDFIRRISKKVHGFYIITPRNRAEFVLPLIEAAKE
jgi:homocysteine S-methyltransferase